MVDIKNIGFAVIGADKVIAKLEKISKGAQSKTDNFLLKVGATIERYAKIRCPVDTGALRASIHHDLVKQGLVFVGAEKDYAAYVEYGTSRMNAQPFMRPSAEQAKSQFGTELKSLAVDILKV